MARSSRRERVSRADRRRPSPPPRVVEPAARVSAVAALERMAGPVALVVAGVAVLGWTWNKWPDAIVDYGRELYLAWQVAEGRTLYVDMAHFAGPLSVALHASLF